MTLKKNILVASVVLLLVTTLVYLLYPSKTAPKIPIRSGSVHLQKYNTPPEPYETKISPEDSLQYGGIIAENNYYWETTSPNKKIKRVAFDRNSGSILVYESTKTTPFNPAKPNLIFQWQFNDATPNLIQGIYGFIDRDTTMYWIYDTQKQLMLDEKGLVYRKKSLKL